MNILLLSNNDLASNYAANLLLPKLSKHRVHVFLSSQVGAKSKKPEAVIELSEFEHSLLKSNALGLKSFEELSEYNETPIESLNNIHQAEGVAKIKRFNPDLIISIRYGHILKDEIIKIPKHGIINLHSGLLPDYRGVMATFWAMLNNEKEIGTTLHFIDDSSIDTGRVIGKTKRTIDYSKSYLWNVLQLYPDGVELVLETVSAIALRANINTVNQNGGGNYFSFPSHNDLERFNKKGLQLFGRSEAFNLT
jgi:methionyl-tRNA formyltransferase